MRAHRVIGALILALAGCGNAEPGLNDAVESVVAGLVADAPAPAPQPSYDEVAALPFASVAFTIERLTEGPPALLAATSFVNGRVWYVDVNRRGVILEGGRVAGTRGMNQDLLGARHLPDDPLATGARPEDWPSETLLVQRARDGLGEEYTRAFRCTIAYHGIEDTPLYQRAAALAHFSESCAAGRVRFQNDHWIDPADGRMWKTRQWVGPATGHVEVSVIRAFGD